LIPDTFLPASYPLSLAQSVFFTLWASMIRKVVVHFLPFFIRSHSTNFF
jgi:hypothetical protein